MSGHLLLVHGWGFGAGVWHPLLRALPEVTAHALDLGFFARGRLEIPPGKPFIAVGHSLGFLWLLDRLQEPDFARMCRGVISINGFSRFAASDDFTCGVPRRVLERMIRRLRIDPAEVLEAFQRQAGLEKRLPVPEGLDREALAAGLSWLAAWDRRVALAGWRGPLLAIAAGDDRVVTPEMTRALFGSQVIRWVPEGGHVLPLTRPEVCAALVGSFVS
ncbi:MAG: alpha/beta hydrolase [Magnetococcales bacterium]|nr:alpha/beta hydrolase [Magnetococcales bacterium]